jgi:hypothetical protein
MRWTDPTGRAVRVYRWFCPRSTKKRESGKLSPKQMTLSPNFAQITKSL